MGSRVQGNKGHPPVRLLPQLHPPLPGPSLQPDAPNQPDPPPPNFLPPHSLQARFSLPPLLSLLSPAAPSPVPPPAAPSPQRSAAVTGARPFAAVALFLPSVHWVISVDLSTLPIPLPPLPHQLAPHLYGLMPARMAVAVGRALQSPILLPLPPPLPISPITGVMPPATSLRQLPRAASASPPVGRLPKGAGPIGTIGVSRTLPWPPSSMGARCNTALPLCTGCWVNLRRAVARCVCYCRRELLSSCVAIGCATAACGSMWLTVTAAALALRAGRDRFGLRRAGSAGWCRPRKSSAARGVRNGSARNATPSP